MNIMVIKFEHGYRLVRTHRVVELWQGPSRLTSFETWGDAISYMDALEHREVQPEKQPLENHQ